MECNPLPVQWYTRCYFDAIKKFAFDLWLGFFCIYDIRNEWMKFWKDTLVASIVKQWFGACACNAVSSRTARHLGMITGYLPASCQRVPSSRIQKGKDKNMETRTMTFGENDDAHREMIAFCSERRAPPINLVVLIISASRWMRIRYAYNIQPYPRFLENGSNLRHTSYLTWIAPFLRHLNTRAMNGKKYISILISLLIQTSPNVLIKL